MFTQEGAQNQQRSLTGFSRPNCTSLAKELKSAWHRSFVSRHHKHNTTRDTQEAISLLEVLLTACQEGSLILKEPSNGGGGGDGGRRRRDALRSEGFGSPRWRRCRLDHLLGNDGFPPVLVYSYFSVLIDSFRALWWFP